MALHIFSLVVGATQFISYVLLSTFLQYRYYYHRIDDSLHWKTQPHKLRAILTAPPSPSPTPPSPPSSLLPPFFTAWAYPTKFLFFPSSPPPPAPRHPLQPLLTTLNLTLSALYATAVTEAHLRSLTSLSPLTLTPPVTLPFTLALSILWQCVLEYYWHRMQHLPFCYRWMHKLHHFYTSPQPFDDLLIHPLEAAGYYVILYSPAFVIPQSLWSFLCYMTVMGVCGVVDHAGIRVQCGGVYDSAEHDEHHRLFTVNYSFPFTFMDRLHGTYRPPPPAPPVPANRKDQ